NGAPFSMGWLPGRSRRCQQAVRCSRRRLSRLFTSAGGASMPRIAVLGANGQVGAELCLLLARIPGVDVVPICRNRSGSAFLRWKGIHCRHGRAAVAEDARSLFADCDVIVNSALASGTPVEMRRTEDAI